MREGTGWKATVTGSEEIACRGRRLDRVEVAVRAALAAADDVDPEQVDMTLSVDLSPPAELAVRDFSRAQAEFAQAQMAYNAMLFRAVRVLAVETISTRDASYLLGLSHQRIAQVRSAS